MVARGSGRAREVRPPEELPPSYSERGAVRRGRETARVLHRNDTHSPPHDKDGDEPEKVVSGMKRQSPRGARPSSPNEVAVEGRVGRLVESRLETEGGVRLPRAPKHRERKRIT